MVTTFVAAALSVLLTGEAIPGGGLVWQTDYSKAMTAAVAQQKPLAVFVGHGDAGYAKLVGEGTIPEPAEQLLAKGFVCVYVDTDTAAGKALSGQFSLSNGLVISTKGGAHQALRHTGTVSSTDLTGYLTKYAETKTVETTVERGLVTTAAPQVITSTCANGQCGTVGTTGYYAPVGIAVPYPVGGYPFGGSSCPNGKCPNAR